MQIHYPDYIELLKGNITVPPDEPLVLIDHLLGFTQDLNNAVLNYLSAYNYKNKITTQYIVTDQLKNRFPNLDLEFSPDLQYQINLQHFENYTSPPDVNYKNFICSFNGSTHVGRRFLTAALHKFNWFNPEYCSKNFTYSIDELDGHIKDYMGKRERIYRKFFIDDSEFHNQIYSFGHVRLDHANNIYSLEPKLTGSFLHLVSETLPTSDYPFITEKAFYSIVTKGLFLSYAQPGWHEFLQRYYGFKLYSKIFDYRFDSIRNPVDRLIELLSMVSKFSHLTTHEWHDLYLVEKDTIDYNYDHYHSKDYLKRLSQPHAS